MAHMPTRMTKLSKAAARDDQGGLHCPKCGGAAFKARRTNGQRLAIGVSGLLLAPLSPKRQVQCETCGAKFRRG